MTELNKDSHLPLFEALRDFNIDEGCPDLSFAQRLALENRWTLQFAERVVIEYKKFIYLALAAGHPVTPSDEVDQAWHQHLVYSDSYWNRLCGEILKRPLHHNPTAGGAAEAHKFNDWYSKTLESYERIFNEKPPADIWPPPSIRFRNGQQFVRVDGDSHWIVPKPNLLTLIFAKKALAGVIVFLFALIIWLGASINAQPDQASPPQANPFLKIFAICFTILIFFCALLLAGKLLGSILGLTCPSCRKKRALARTDGKMKGRREYQCKYCGHMMWLAGSRGGGIGCGGCGAGCGGGGCGS